MRRLAYLFFVSRDGFFSQAFSSGSVSFLRAGVCALALQNGVEFFHR